MDFDYKILGILIRNLRKKKNLSQEVLSGLAGIARTHLTMIENGTKQANIETLWRLSRALNIPLSHLILEVEKELENRK